MGMPDMHRGAHFCPLEEDACQLIRSSVAAVLALLKALLIVFTQAVQRMTAAGGGKDEESFSASQTTPMALYAMSAQTAMWLWPLFQPF